MLSVGVSTQPYLSAWPRKQNWTKTLMYKTTILPYRLCATTKEFSSFHITAATCLLWISPSQLGWWDIALIRVKCGITLLTWTYGTDQTIRGTMWYWETNSKWMHQYFCLYMVLPRYNLKKSKPKQKKNPTNNKKTSKHQAWQDLGVQLDSPILHPMHPTSFNQLFLPIINLANSACTPRQTLHLGFDKAQKGNVGAWNDFQERKQ